MECNLFEEVEEIKREMESIMSYNHQLAFKEIDPGNIGFIEIKTLDGFFKRN